MPTRYPSAIQIATGPLSYGGSQGTSFKFKRLRSATLNLQLPTATAKALPAATPIAQVGAVYQGLVIGVTYGGKVIKPMFARWPDRHGKFSMVLPASYAARRCTSGRTAANSSHVSPPSPAGPVDLASWPADSDLRCRPGSRRSPSHADAVAGPGDAHTVGRRARRRRAAGVLLCGCGARSADGTLDLAEQRPRRDTRRSSTRRSPLQTSAGFACAGASASPRSWASRASSPRPRSWDRRTVYLQDLRSTVFALHRLRWERSAGRPASTPRTTGRRLALGSGLLFGATDSGAFALSASSGPKLWQRHLTSSQRAVGRHRTRRLGEDSGS